ncbi:MAG: hypothetical protein WAT81_03285 [Candidatus Moraniibacteriota bacterium]
MEKKTKKSNAALLGVIGASLAGVAAGVYFFFGPKGKVHQRHAKTWVVKMKAEVIEKLELAQEITEPVYQEIIDTVAKEYTKAKRAGHAEIESVAKDLKKHWKSMSKLALAVKTEALRQVSKKAKVAKK